MPQTMQQVHEAGHHTREPRKRCPLCKAGTPAHSPYPFVYVTWKTPDGGTRSSFAEEVKRDSKLRAFALRDRHGEDLNPPELLVADPVDLVDVSEAHQNLKYGTLQCIELPK